MEPAWSFRTLRTFREHQEGAGDSKPASAAAASIRISPTCYALHHTWRKTERRRLRHSSLQPEPSSRTARARHDSIPVKGHRAGTLNNIFSEALSSCVPPPSESAPAAAPLYERFLLRGWKRPFLIQISSSDFSEVRR